MNETNKKETPLKITSTMNKTISIIKNGEPAKKKKGGLKVGFSIEE
jgi:hypothetical protein